MSKQAAKEAQQNINAVMEPWINAMRAWNRETEKFQQGVVERMNKAVEDHHQVTRETLDMATSVRSTMQKQLTNQVERTCDWMTSIMP